MKHLIKITTLMFVFSIIPVFASANTTGYAWSESVGWFDFSNAIITDTAITGYAYNDNTGWLVLDGVTHANGTFSGYAWSESVGYFDFSNVTISSGTLSGYAYNDNTGWLNFTDTSVTTTWAPTTQPTRRSGSSGGSVPRPVQTPTTSPTLPNTIEGLQALLATLQAQLTQLLANTPALSKNPFTRDLDLNTQGEDVIRLQNLLIQKGYTIPAGATGFFGPQKRQALINFQQANNITPAVGYFGPITRQSLTFQY